MPAGSTDSTPVPASVSKTCLVRFDNNKYSSRPALSGGLSRFTPTADRIVIRQDGRIVAEHARSFGAAIHLRSLALRAGAGSQTGALRNGAPFKDWVLPAAIERVRRKLASADDGNRQMVDILNAV